MKACPRSLAALHRDAPAMLRDDAVDDGQTEAGANAHGLRGEERLENALHRRFVHAAPRVPHREMRNLPLVRGDLARRLRLALQCDGDGAHLLADRLGGVDDEIDHDLMEI